MTTRYALWVGATLIGRYPTREAAFTALRKQCWHDQQRAQIDRDGRRIWGTV